MDESKEYRSFWVLTANKLREVDKGGKLSNKQYPASILEDWCLDWRESSIEEYNKLTN